MGAIPVFCFQTGPEKVLLSTPQASFRASLRAGQTRSPASTVPAGECIAITNRWCGEGALDFSRLL